MNLPCPGRVDDVAEPASQHNERSRALGDVEQVRYLDLQWHRSGHGMLITVHDRRDGVSLRHVALGGVLPEGRSDGQEHFGVWSEQHGAPSRREVV